VSAAKRRPQRMSRTDEANVHLLEKLSMALGAPGDEQDVAAIIRNELSSLGTPERDRLGSLIFRIGDPLGRPRIMIAAHMDEVAFMVSSITKEGFLRFQTLGGWSATNLAGQRVIVRGKNGPVEGMIGSIPPHFLRKKEGGIQSPQLEDLLIDIGALNAKEAARQGIFVGAFVLPSPTFIRLQNPDLVLGKSFDDRVGCALLVEVMKTLAKIPLPGTLYGAATVQEEVGLRGARTAAQHVNPDIAIVLEGPPADDFPGIAKDGPQGALGGGVQIRCFDPTMVSNSRLRDHVIAVAERRRIKYQLTVRSSGGTDAGSIHLTGIGVPTIVLGIPVRYIHCHHGILHLGDYRKAAKLLLNLIPTLDRKFSMSL